MRVSGKIRKTPLSWNEFDFEKEGAKKQTLKLHPNKHIVSKLEAELAKSEDLGRGWRKVTIEINTEKETKKAS